MALFSIFGIGWMEWILVVLVLGGVFFLIYWLSSGGKQE